MDTRLVSLGRREPLQGIVDQARYHVALATRHAAALAGRNWTPADTQALAEAVSRLDDERSRQLEARMDSRQLTREQGAALADAKHLIRQIRLLVPQVLRKHPTSGVTVDSFDAGGELGRSVPRILKYLQQILIPVVRIDGHLAPYFEGRIVSEMVGAARTRLEAADSQQELAHASLPGDGEALYEQKGRVLEMIQDLNAIGKVAFAGDAVTSGQFNRDLLLRARRKRTAPAPTPPVESTPEPA